jgi:hypothetical protein
VVQSDNATEPKHHPDNFPRRRRPPLGEERHARREDRSDEDLAVEAAAAGGVNLGLHLGWRRRIDGRRSALRGEGEGREEKEGGWAGERC